LFSFLLVFSKLPDWGACVHLALQTLLPEVVVLLFMLEVELQIYMEFEQFI
jgi:hypothetical protein